ncbi:hypothetical protein PS712_05748 [Pseudomonas fluorescens]|uniref:Uncharacterized protein n=1 Tax=Pseudomonas fluorescens TaxID=294 RepID=A0A5E7FJZ1_PSEFL|nr:hypothetical protein PS712_05748 [Pseudomonas fluorescens]
MVEHAGLFCISGQIERSQPSAAPTLKYVLPVGAAEGYDLLIFIQNNPSLSGNSYSDTAVIRLPDLPGLPNVGSFARHSTK